MVVIVDYGSSNLQSVMNVIDEVGDEYLVTSNPDEIRKSKKIILPGVGSIKPAINKLNSLGLLEVLNDAVIKNNTAFLGICLGMQMLFESSKEGGEETKCFGWINGKVMPLNSSSSDWKIPHIGWSETDVLKEDAITDKIKNSSFFYYCHSFYAEGVNSENLLMSTDFDSKNITTAVVKDNIYGVQFHPERSSKAGIKLIENFLNLN